MQNNKHLRDILTIENPDKWQHFALTILEKVEILKKLNDDATLKYIANTYGIGVRTVHDICKSKDKILNFYSNSDSNAGLKDKKLLHEAKSKDLDSIIYEWFKQQRSDCVPVSDPLLILKVKQFHAELKIQGPCDFTALVDFTDLKKKDMV